MLELNLQLNNVKSNKGFEFDSIISAMSCDILKSSLFKYKALQLIQVVYHSNI